METVVNVKHISKRFGQQLALNDVSLTVKQGEIYGLIGKMELVRQRLSK